MPLKRTSTSVASAMTQAAIRQLVANSITRALEARAANMANADNTNRNTKPREAPTHRNTLILRTRQLLSEIYQGFLKECKVFDRSNPEKKTYIWGEDQETTFQLLKQKLCEALTLALPVGNNDFVVYCDASHQGLGVVLMQREKYGRMILESAENGQLLWPIVEENGMTRPKKYSELSTTEAIQADCDVKATNIILQGLPPEVYALVSTHKVTKELWERIQMLMQGTS
nr:reverse transcriptase domain-containing protein [Tanacetum cinerariifolium]